MGDDELQALRTSLLHRIGVQLGPDDGEEAFDQHILLAVRIDRAVRICDQNWQGFFAEFFPEGRNERSDAGLLWENWRQGPVKDACPTDKVSLTHGHPQYHWVHDGYGALCIDLESMWADFEAAVDNLIAALANDEDRRATVLRRLARTNLDGPTLPVVPQQALGSGRTYTGLIPDGSGVAAADSVSGSRLLDQ